VVARPEGPRIAPIPVRQWPPEMRGAVDALHPPVPRHAYPEPRDDRPKGMNILGTFARHPALATAFHTFNGHVLFATTLSARQRELVVLRVAAVRGSDYEWAQHAVLAGDVGIDPDDMARVEEGPDAEGWEPLERAMVRAVDELLAGARVTDATWSALAAELDDRQLMDLVFTVGAYDVVAMALLSFGVEHDEDLSGRK
jgi:alkylhydroperoxidase family enzyme